MQKQLPKTVEFIKHMEEVYERACTSEEEYENFSDEERYVFLNPMAHLAEAICDDTGCFNEKIGWAVDLAKYLLIITGVEDRDIKL